MNDLEDFQKSGMLQFKITNFTIKKASKRFNLSKEDVKIYYLKVREKAKKEYVNKGLVYFLLS